MGGVIGIDFEPIRCALFDWINCSINTLASGSLIDENHKDATKIFRAETNYVAPERDDNSEDNFNYVEYKFLTGLIPIGQHDELKFDTAQDKWKLIGRREFTITVTAIGDQSQEYIAQIEMGLGAPNICDKLRAAGISIIEKNPIADATVFQEEDHELRSVLDVRFRTALENFDIVSGLSSIDRVILQNKIVDPEADSPYTVTITKP